ESGIRPQAPEGRNGSQRSRSESQRFDPDAVPLVTRVESVNVSGRHEGASSSRLLACGISWWLKAMNDVTRILSAIEQGDRQAPDQLLPLVYDELRKLAAARMAAEKPGHTLDATALVHEAYLRLVGDQHFDDRGHFFAAAAEAMRRILVNHARDRVAHARSAPGRTPRTPPS